MAKTAKDIQGDILNLLKASGITDIISGSCYRNGYRPRDSRLEDAVVIFTTGLADEIQTGVVTVHLYVPDIELNGVYVENGARTAVLERALQMWVDSLTCARSGYKFEQQYTISTEADTAIQQHFVVAMLRYSYFGGDEPVTV